MRLVSFYQKETGLFNAIHLTTSDEGTIALNIPPGNASVDGHHDHLSKQVDIATGQVIEYQPPRPSEQHEWNASTKRWQLTAAALEQNKKRPEALARIAALDDESLSLMREGMLELMTGQDTKQTYQRLAGIEEEITSLRPLVHEIEHLP